MNRLTYVTRAISLLTLFGLCPTVVRAQQTLTYRDLVRRLIDLEHPAMMPAVGETCRQWSSWDRSSRYDEQTGKYVNWSANNDGPNFIRREGERVVMAEMEGPGCIWRIWSALAETGHVKIYLDGAEQPAVDLPFVNYFDGQTVPFEYPGLSYNLADQGCRGQNLYLPIPYQKSCKVVAEPGWGRYYQFTFTTYPPGTVIPTFSSQLAEQHADELQAVNQFFLHRKGADPAGHRAGEQIERGTLKLAAGDTQAIQLSGPRAITAIRGDMDFENRQDEMAALRQLVLKITWDEEPQPAVWCPWGDFFGTAPGKNLYRTLLTGMTEDGGYALWYMPFARRALIEITNQGPVDREVNVEIVHAPLTKPIEQLGRFHCKWHRDTTVLPEDRWPDWPLLETKGRGRFCGVMLHVWNPRGGWWGEGDEKFFVDGEHYPSTFGTGSEDYFGYAWCNPGLFQNAYHAQTMTSGNRGHQSVLRWQLVDNVPFQKSFDGYIEKYFRTEERGTQYAAVACWYLDPQGEDPYGAVPVGERHDYYVNPPLVAGGFRVLNQPRGNVTTQGLRNFKADAWKNDDHLWWTGAKPGDKLELAVPVEKTGRYRVSVVLTKARDYAMVQLSMNGQPAGEPIDLYNPAVIPTGPIDLGVFELTAPQANLQVEIVGKNEAAVPSYMFGIDQVLLEPQR